VEEVGLRSVLCYETTDRNGLAGRDAGIAENRAFLASGPTPLTRGTVGAHASFTLSDESLDLLAAAGADSGVHVHVAEDRCDAEDSRRRSGSGVVERLRGHGLVGERALLVHCVHLSGDELKDAREARASVVHCPRSNSNNGVGRAPTGRFWRAALGTDGLDEDMLAEARAAFLGLREAGRDDALEATVRMLAEGHRLAGSFFGLPLGRLNGGAPADLVVLDYRAPTPLTADNLAGHLLFGLDRSHVRSTMVAGRFVLRDRRIVHVDEEAVFAGARRAADALWERMCCPGRPGRVPR
jgi:cytosine/adenosine deaminase-related metal-dependent hydrolase